MLMVLTSFLGLLIRVVPWGIYLLVLFVYLAAAGNFCVQWIRGFYIVMMYLIFGYECTKVMLTSCLWGMYRIGWGSKD